MSTQKSNASAIPASLVNTLQLGHLKGSIPLVSIGKRRRDCAEGRLLRTDGHFRRNPAATNHCYVRYYNLMLMMYRFISSIVLGQRPW